MSDVPTDPRHRELYDLAVRIGLAWREMRRGASAAGLRDWLYGTGDESIEQGQMDTLDQLALRPAWRMSELADALRIDPSSVTRAMQRLEKMGLAERSPSKDDGRVVEVRITDVGPIQHRKWPSGAASCSPTSSASTESANCPSLPTCSSASSSLAVDGVRTATDPAASTERSLLTTEMVATSACP